jgi:hypothetical protein
MSDGRNQTTFSPCCQRMPRSVVKMLAPRTSLVSMHTSRRCHRRNKSTHIQMGFFARPLLNGLHQPIRYAIAAPRYHIIFSCVLQPIQAFEHPSFQSMIQIAARATKGVKLPARRQSRQAIIDIYMGQLSFLRKTLNVCQKHTSFATNISLFLRASP